MRITPAVASIVGRTSPSRWAQVYISPGSYGVVEVTHETDPRTIGVSILNNLREALDPLPLTPQKLQEVVTRVWNDSMKTLIVLVPVGTTMCIVMKGEGAVYIRRGDTFATLLAKGGAVAGEAKVSDTLLLVTASIEASISIEHISQMFDHLPASQAAEKLTMYLNQDTAPFGGAALVYQVSSLADELEETVMESTKGEPWFGFVRGKLTKITQNWKTPILSRVIFRSKVREWRRHPQKFVLLLGISIVFLLFLVSTILGLLRLKPSIPDKQLQSIQVLFDEGVSLIELNPSKARISLRDAKSQIAPLLVRVNEKTDEGKALMLLSQKIDLALNSALRIYSVKPEVFYDMSLVKEKSVASTFAIANDVLGIIDRQSLTAFSLTVSGKKATVLGGGTVSSQTAQVSVYADRVYTLTDNGIFQLSTTEKEVPKEPVIKKDPKWGIIGDFVVYAGNMYLLDVTAHRIWKYVETDTGFSEMREYLNPDTFVDVSKATSMAIDGSIWVGTQDGTVLRFTQGKENPIILRELEPELGKPIALYTNDESNYLYILDNANKRVVIFDKEGNYVAQYVWEADIAVTEFVVSQSQKRVLLLAGGVLYSFGLQ